MLLLRGAAMNRELFTRTDCIIHSVAGIDAITEAEACVKCGAERRWVVPVERDYEAASEYARRVEGIYVSPEDVSGIVDAALGIGGDDGTQ